MTILWRSLGGLCVALGVLGIFLPVLPTTPFLLAAIWFFVQGRSHWAEKLKQYKLLAPYLGGRGNLTWKAKSLSLSILWLTMTISCWAVWEVRWLFWLLIGICVAITVHIVLIGTTKKSTLSTKSTARPEDRE